MNLFNKYTLKCSFHEIWFYPKDSMWPPDTASFIKDLAQPLSTSEGSRLSNLSNLLLWTINYWSLSLHSRRILVLYSRLLFLTNFQHKCQDNLTVCASTMNLLITLFQSCLTSSATKTSSEAFHLLWHDSEQCHLRLSTSDHGLKHTHLYTEPGSPPGFTITFSICALQFHWDLSFPRP